MARNPVDLGSRVVVCLAPEDHASAPNCYRRSQSQRARTATCEPWTELSLRGHRRTALTKEPKFGGPGKHQEPDLRPLFAVLPLAVDSSIGVRRQHPVIDNGDVWLGALHKLNNCVGVSGRPGEASKPAS